MAIEQNNELIVSRIVDELANTYYEMGKLDEAEQAFRNLLGRFVDFLWIFVTLFVDFFEFGFLFPVDMSYIIFRYHLLMKLSCLLKRKEVRVFTCDIDVVILLI